MPSRFPIWLTDQLRAWRLAYEKSAERDHYRRLLQDHSCEPDDLEHGAALAIAHIQVVEHVFAQRAIDGQLVETEVRHFLSMQCYAREPPIGWAVRFEPSPGIQLFVNALGELDFEDLVGRFAFRSISIDPLGRYFEVGEVAEIVEHVRQDLCFDSSEFSLKWNEDGGCLTIDLQELDHDEEDDSEE